MRKPVFRVSARLFISEEERLTICEVKTKMLISCAVTAWLMQNLDFLRQATKYVFLVTWLT